ncbi:hypothetical protein AGLY_005405 [Aphis glycines]|uniref:Uncharacterized protein n=1 Tax=Aphis glycines TaxID=307491 RepID=A0A6G0TW95_APHGL|nr:hypothetical protein AGLY_005405 [Aphis glycines]
MLVMPHYLRKIRENDQMSRYEDKLHPSLVYSRNIEHCIRLDLTTVEILCCTDHIYLRQRLKYSREIINKVPLDLKKYFRSIPVLTNLKVNTDIWHIVERAIYTTILFTLQGTLVYLLANLQMIREPFFVENASLDSNSTHSLLRFSQWPTLETHYQITVIIRLFNIENNFQFPDSFYKKQNGIFYYGDLLTIPLGKGDIDYSAHTDFILASSPPLQLEILLHPNWLGCHANYYMGDLLLIINSYTCSY